MVGTESTRLSSPPALVSSMVGRTVPDILSTDFSTRLGPACSSSLEVFLHPYPECAFTNPSCLSVQKSGNEDLLVQI